MQRINTHVIATTYRSQALEENTHLTTVYDFSAVTLDGKELSLKTFEGKVLLIVNTASACGFTPQYEQLEALYRTFAPRGFAVLGFPCNQFGGQEPGSARRSRRSARRSTT